MAPFLLLRCFQRRDPRRGPALGTKDPTADRPAQHPGGSLSFPLLAEKSSRPGGGLGPSWSPRPGRSVLAGAPPRASSLGGLWTPGKRPWAVARVFFQRLQRQRLFGGFSGLLGCGSCNSVPPGSSEPGVGNLPARPKRRGPQLVGRARPLEAMVSVPFPSAPPPPPRPAPVSPGPERSGEHLLSPTQGHARAGPPSAPSLQPGPRASNVEGRKAVPSRPDPRRGAGCTDRARRFRTEPGRGRGWG